jgi:hypothetical protein
MKTDLIKFDPLEIDLYNSKKKTDSRYSNLSKKIINKPWGYEFVIFQNKKFAIWVLCIKPKKYTSMHCHALKRTILIPLNNELRVSTLGNIYYNKKIYNISPRVFHQTHNNGLKDKFLIEIEFPNLKNDIIRLHDYYGRLSSKFSKENKLNSIKKNNNLLKKKIKFKSLKFGKKNVIFLQNFKNSESLILDNFKRNFNYLIILNGAIKCYTKNKKKFSLYARNIYSLKKIFSSEKIIIQKYTQMLII